MNSSGGRLVLIALALVCFVMWPECPGAEARTGSSPLPRPLSSYHSAENASVVQVLADRARAEPFNVAATALFFLAILHTFFASNFTRLAHRLEAEHCVRLKAQQTELSSRDPAARSEVSFAAQLFHFLGEVEAVFGIWVVPLMIFMVIAKDWRAAEAYFDDLNFTEPLFVVVIMTIAASKPVVCLTEIFLASIARLGRSSVAAWWFSILTFGPLLGSFITEPAAMTISALLLGDKFFRRKPPLGLAYVTLGLLFVNISVGGTLTQFAAPPVLMVAGRWNWDMVHMWTHFGWKAMVAIVVANGVFFLIFRRQFQLLSPAAALAGSTRTAVPFWITAVHVFFLFWTVLTSHSPALFVGGFLFYLAFTQTTEHHQDDVRLRPALLVGFFLAGLVIHGGLQAWWIEPVLTRLSTVPLFFGAVGLTAFNDNAAITYLASLVPEFSPMMKYSVVAGAIAGGGLTVIANAPNPAGQSILGPFFPDGISAGRLFLAALLPTVIVSAMFLLFPG